MANGKFLAGLTVGILAGVAAKYAYDNKDELVDIALDNYYTAKDEIATFAQHTKDKVNAVVMSEDGQTTIFDTAKDKFNEMKSYANEQVSEIKDMVNEAKKEVSEELSEDEDDFLQQDEYPDEDSDFVELED